MEKLNPSQHIAVIGLAGRFPGADTVDTFWENLKQGKESLTEFSVDQLLSAGESLTNLNHKNYIPVRGIINNVKNFDADFFSMSDQEAKILDPQHRVLLECAWECFEDAGYIPEHFEDRIGAFTSCGFSFYLINNLMKNTEFLKTADPYQLLLGNDKDFLATRIAYKLNLRGPAMTIACGCSSSLVSLHYAMQSLLNGECEMALAGGISISIPQEQGYLYRKDMIGSADGHCRAFDIHAAGTVKSNGAGIVLLKPLQQAIIDNDHIYCTIMGSAINNDGSNKIGYTAPSINQQASVISEAMSVAGINPKTVQYIETHGTGTILGDPIEIAALGKAYKKYSLPNQSCALASVKSNIGHLDVAAGIVAFIKMSLALYYKQIPASLHYETPNPKINFIETPFFVNTKLMDWEVQDNSPRRGALSSFGVGGTNVHIILQEANESHSIATQKHPQLFLFSSKDKTGLITLQEKFIDYLKKTKANINDIAYTLHVGRKHFSSRDFCIAESFDQLIDKIKNNLKQSKNENSNTSNFVFMFSGQGSQYHKMSYTLYQSNAKFRDIFDTCNDKLKKYDLDIKEIIYSDDHHCLINETQFTQPALFLIEYAMANLLMHYGIQPSAFIGHSIGEYVAAVLSGIMSLDDALAIIIKRGKLIQKLPKGSMLSVLCSYEKLKNYLNQFEKLSVALFNSPTNIVLSGDPNEIQAIQTSLTAEKISCQILSTSHAFHSHMLDEILDEFKKTLDQYQFSYPSIPIISNLSGKWLREECVTSDYWVQQMRSTVQFSAGISFLQQELKPWFIEVGPGRALGTFVMQHGVTSVLNTIPHQSNASEEIETFYQAIGKLWQLGAKVDATKFYPLNKVNRVSIPTYQWQRKEHWVDPDLQDETQTINNKNESFENNISIEKQLINAWAIALGSNPKNHDENFFQVGGDSVSAINFINNLPEYLQNEISIIKLYEFPTIKQLCNYITYKNQPNKVSWAVSSANLEQEIILKGDEL